MGQIVVFHGISHRAGCTMTAQSVAELAAAEKKELAVLFAALNGRESTEYMSEKTACVDEFKIQLKSGIGIDKGMVGASKKIENLYIISGVEKEEETRMYMPEMAEVLIQSLSDKFDLIVIDSGSEIDNGLAYGALKMKGLKYLVMEQTESSIRRFEKMRGIYEKLGICFDKYILSKYYSDDPLTANYTALRLSLNKALFFEVGFSDRGRVAEIEYKTLLDVGQDKYRAETVKITNDIMRMMNLDNISARRKRSWNSFI